MNGALEDEKCAIQYCEIAVAKWDERGRSSQMLASAMLRAGTSLLMREAGDQATAELLRAAAAAIDGGYLDKVA